jgi:hypothetical protein
MLFQQEDEIEKKEVLKKGTYLEYSPTPLENIKKHKLAYDYLIYNEVKIKLIY